MKNLFRSLVLALPVLMFAYACQENMGGGDDGSKESACVDYSDGQIKLILKDARTIEADGDGVSIAIKDVQNYNVQFELRPGANIASYRVDVIPLAILYNTLIDNGNVGSTQEEVEDVLITLLTTSTSTNGVVFTESLLEDYQSHMFDWMNTEYHNGNILADCDYVICVVPCFDEEGLEPAGVNLGWFRTPRPELVGDPDVRIDVSVSYRAFQAVHEPNDDCKYVCYWSYLTESIDAYEDVVGERMLRDFVRSASAAYDVANASDMSYHVDFGQSADAGVSQTSIAVALDVNGTPSEYVARRNFTLKPIPDSPVAVHSIEPLQTAASIFWLKVNFEPTCKNCYYRWMSKDAAEAIKKYTPEQKTAYARDLAENGWGVANPDFHFNTETNLPTGDSESSVEHQIVAYEPQEQYVIVSVGENFFGEVSELCFSEPVVMKPRVTDRPETCMVTDDEFRCVLDNPSRTGFRYNFHFDNPDEIALIYFQIVSPVDPEIRKENPEMCPPENVETATHAEWMKFFFETYLVAADGEKVLQVNTWDVDPDLQSSDTANRKGMSMFGYEPGVEFVVAYCVEDINGVVSKVRFEKCRTQDVKAGADPVADISAKLIDGEWMFTFSANEDTGTLYYMTSSYGDANYNNLCLPYILSDPYGDYPTYDSIFNVWDERMLDLGLTTQSLTTYSTEEVRSDGTIILALCLPVGEKADGSPAYGKLQHLLIVDGQIKKLEDYRTK